jgi:hypothetical protein
MATDETKQPEVNTTSADKPEDDERWKKTAPIVISLLALCFSLGTTAVSAYNSHQEDIRSNRRDVRAILQRLSKLPIENFEWMQKIKGTGQGEALSGMLNQENILLSTQAAELIDRYPDSFTSTEYFAVAFSLASSNIIGKVPAMYRRAMDSATTSNDFNVAARAFAGYMYSKGQREEGKRLFEEAMRVWDKFPEPNAYLVNSFDLVTLLYWGQAEFAAGNRAEAKAHVADARKRLGAMPPGPYTDGLKSQLDFGAKYIDQ